MAELLSRELLETKGFATAYLGVLTQNYQAKKKRNKTSVQKNENTQQKIAVSINKTPSAPRSRPPEAHFNVLMC